MSSPRRRGSRKISIKQQIFAVKSSIYLALCWIPAVAGMTFN
ncbi:MAG: hypothetical protein ACEY3D_00885 [Rickettsia sp.]